jgi:tetratricopeptide (TPR) repeat protein
MMRLKISFKPLFFLGIISYLGALCAEDWKWAVIKEWREGQNANLIEKKLEQRTLASGETFFPYLVRGVLLQDKGLYPDAVHLLNIAGDKLEGADSENQTSWDMLIRYQRILAYQAMRNLKAQRTEMDRYKQKGYPERQEEETLRMGIRRHPYTQRFEQIEGVWLLRAGQVEAAISLLEDWVGENGLSPLERARRERTLFQVRGYDPSADATQQLQEGLELAGEIQNQGGSFDRASVSYALGKHAARMGKWEIARKCYQESAGTFFDGSSLHPMERLLRIETAQGNWEKALATLQAARIWQSRCQPYILQELFKETRLAEAQLLWMLGYPDRALALTDKLLKDPVRGGFRFEHPAQWELEVLLTARQCGDLSYKLQSEMMLYQGKPIQDKWGGMTRSYEKTVLDTRIRNKVLLILEDPLFSQMSFFQTFPLPDWLYPDLYEVLGAGQIRGLKQRQGLSGEREEQLWKWLEPFLFGELRMNVQNRMLAESVLETIPQAEFLLRMRLQARLARTLLGDSHYQACLERAPVLLLGEDVVLPLPLEGEALAPNGLRLEQISRRWVVGEHPRVLINEGGVPQVKESGIEPPEESTTLDGDQRWAQWLRATLLANEFLETK